MKKHLTMFLRTLCLGGLLFWGGLTSQAQTTVPAPVKAAFAKIQPGISPNWKQNGNAYEARFIKEGQKLVYIYDGAGVLQVKKSVTSEASLPGTIRATLMTQYPTQGDVTEAYKVATRSNQKYYEVIVQTPTSLDRLKMSETGTVLDKATKPTALASNPSQPAVGANQAAKPSQPAVASNPTAAQPAQPAVAANQAATKPAQPAVASNQSATKPVQPVSKPPMASASQTPSAATSTKINKSNEEDLEYVEDEDLFNDEELFDDTDLDMDVDDDELWEDDEDLFDDDDIELE